MMGYTQSLCPSIAPLDWGTEYTPALPEQWAPKESVRPVGHWVEKLDQVAFSITNVADGIKYHVNAKEDTKNM